MAVVNNEHSKKIFSCARLVRVFFILVCSFLVVQFLSSHCSYAATWPVSGKAQLSCSLEFHKQYVRAGKTYVHQGVDISASTGEDILAPVSGTVSFVGSVPSGDSLVNGGGSGQTMKAVSIKTSSGKVLTLSPVEGIAVKRGASVSEGEVIASLAESGDRSSLCTHLHLGLKMGKTYYDPMTLFSAVKSEPVVPAKSTSAAKAKGYKTIKVSPEVEGVPAQGLASGQGMSSAGAVDASVIESVAESNKAATQKSGSPAYEQGSISSGNVSWHPAKNEELSLGQKLAQPFKNVWSACVEQFISCKVALQEFSAETGMPIVLLYVCIAIAAALILGAICFAFARFIAPNLRNVCRRAVSFLFKHLRGDSMQKLFPASGDAFMTRSR